MIMDMALKHVLLTVLTENDATGYDIVKRFQDVLGYFWNASHQQIYQELGKLHKTGLVTYQEISQQDKPDKKLYRITSVGEAVLKEWIESPTKQRSINENILVKMYAGIFLETTQLQTILEAEKAEAEEQLQQYINIEEQYFSAEDTKTRTDHLVYIALRKGIHKEQYRIAWVDESLAIIGSLPD